MHPLCCCHRSDLELRGGGPAGQGAAAPPPWLAGRRNSFHRRRLCDGSGFPPEGLWTPPPPPPPFPNSSFLIFTPVLPLHPHVVGHCQVCCPTAVARGPPQQRSRMTALLLCWLFSATSTSSPPNPPSCYLLHFYNFLSLSCHPPLPRQLLPSIMGQGRPHPLSQTTPIRWGSLFSLKSLPPPPPPLPPSPYLGFTELESRPSPTLFPRPHPSSTPPWTIVAVGIFYCLFDLGCLSCLSCEAAAVSISSPCY